MRAGLDVVTISGFGGPTAAMINVSYTILSLVFLHRVSKRKLGTRTEIGGLCLWDEGVELGTKVSGLGMHAIAVWLFVSRTRRN
jgi:hypothetical protein